MYIEFSKPWSSTQKNISSTNFKQPEQCLPQYLCLEVSSVPFVLSSWNFYAILKFSAACSTPSCCCKFVCQKGHSQDLFLRFLKWEWYPRELYRMLWHLISADLRDAAEWLGAETIVHIHWSGREAIGKENIVAFTGIRPASQLPLIPLFLQECPGIFINVWFSL